MKTFELNIILTEMINFSDIEFDNMETAVLFAFILFLIFKLVEPPVKKSKKAIEEPKPKAFAEIAREQIGQMRQVGNYSVVGGKLLESKNDVETYMLLARVNKQHIRAEEEAKYKTKVKNIMIVSTVIMTLITALIVIMILGGFSP